MTTIIKKNTKASVARKQITRVKRKSRKPFDADKYSGVVKIKKDPLKLQKEWRREWDRIPS